MASKNNINNEGEKDFNEDETLLKPPATEINIRKTSPLKEIPTANSEKSAVEAAPLDHLEESTVEPDNVIESPNIIEKNCPVEVATENNHIEVNNVNESPFIIESICLMELPDGNKHLEENNVKENPFIIENNCLLELSNGNKPIEIGSETETSSHVENNSCMELSDENNSKIVFKNEKKSSSVIENTFPVELSTGNKSDGIGEIDQNLANEANFNLASEEVKKKETFADDSNYRNISDSSVSDLSSASDNESCSEVEVELEDIKKGPKKQPPVCRGELLMSDLPPIEDLKISVPEKDSVKIGTVSSIVDLQVVVQALPNSPALDLGSVLFLENGKLSLGEVFDVFGQVKEPFYTVRFNSESHARERGVTVGADVYYAPKSIHTCYVFVSEMMKMKGSDASWEHNNEPPQSCLDYSDDEEERAMRRAIANQKRGEDKDSGPPKKRRGVRHKPKNPFHVTSNGIHQRSYHDLMTPEMPPIRGHSPQAPPMCSPSFPPCSIFPSPMRGRSSFPMHPPGHPPVFSASPPNFSFPPRTAFNPPLLGSRPRSFPPLHPSLPPPSPSPSFCVPPPGPMHPIPSFISPFMRPPHYRHPVLCPPRFRPIQDNSCPRGPPHF